MAVGDAHVFPGILTKVLIQLSVQSYQLLFLHASAEVRGKNMPERKFVSTGYQTHNHQVMSPTRSPLCYLGGARNCWSKDRLSHEVDWSFDKRQIWAQTKLKALADDKFNAA